MKVWLKSLLQALCYLAIITTAIAAYIAGFIWIATHISIVQFFIGLGVVIFVFMTFDIRYNKFGDE